MSLRDFNGPLFIVGMPRSGTKLLRTLLNTSSTVFIPDVETHFLPYWFKHWEVYGDLSDPDQFRQFYDGVINLPYFLYTGEFQANIDCKEWHSNCETYDLPGVFEALVKHDAGYPVNSGGVWGDKTPSYLGHMLLLKALFPTARFLHIVRDARDYCLSMQNAWGKSLLRAAQMWNDGVTAAITQGEALGDAYMQVRYEDLISNPQAQLVQVCDFIGVPFEEQMLSLDSIPENLGDTKGVRQIVSNNVEKYRTRMDSEVRMRIESIACVPMKSLGYPIEYTGTPRRLSAAEMGLFKLHDGLNLIRFELGNRNIFEAARLRWRLYSVSGNRSRS